MRIGDPSNPYTLALVSAVLLLLSSSQAFAITGNDWKGYSEDKRLAYLSGVYEAWKQGYQMFFNDDYDAAITGLSRFASCANIMTSAQFAAIVERFMKENKEQVRNMEMPLISFLAIDRVCAQKR